MIYTFARAMQKFIRLFSVNYLWKTLGVFGTVRKNFTSVNPLSQKLFISRFLNKSNDGSSLMAEFTVVVRETGVRFSSIVLQKRW